MMQAFDIFRFASYSWVSLYLSTARKSKCES